MTSHISSVMGFLTTSLHKNCQNDVKLLETWWFWPILGKVERAELTCEVIKKSCSTFLIKFWLYPIFILAAAYIADNLCTKNGNSSFFKLKIRGFKSRAAYDGARTVYEYKYIYVLIDTKITSAKQYFDCPRSSYSSWFLIGSRSKLWATFGPRSFGLTKL